MIFSEKLQIIRKSHGLTQEELAEQLQVSRQAVAKWESGQSYPDIMNLIQLSERFHVTVDYLVKDEECSISLSSKDSTKRESLIEFLLEAKKNTYAGKSNSCASSRPASHDYRYENAEYLYIDTYLGGECFSGEEAVWIKNEPVYAMNYSGRVLQESFSGNFLKAALREATEEMPYRGPACYQEGEYTYKCSVNGDIRWFQGFEEIYCNNRKVYECFYHGGVVR